MPEHERITRDPEVMGGEPVIAGTRVPVATILNDLATGSAESQILRDYPRFKLEEIGAALDHPEARVQPGRAIAPE